MEICFEELAPHFQRSVELAAVAAASAGGRGDKDLADAAATSELRRRLNKTRMRGVIRVGEGELDGCDDKTMLRRGEQVGLGWGESYTTAPFPEVDIATDPLEGTILCADGVNGAICVAAFAERGGIIDAPDIYMDKIVVGKAGRGRVDLNAPIEDNLKAVADGLGRKVSSLSVMVLDRPRHEELMKRIYKTGARVLKIPHGDLTAGIVCAMGKTNIAMAVGIGGGPEGFLVAAAQHVLGGEIQGRLLTKEMMTDPGDRAVMPDNVIETLQSLGIHNPTGVLRTEDMIPAKKIVFTFAAVTDSRLADGVHIFDPENEESSGHREVSYMWMANGNERVMRKSIVTEVTNWPDFVFEVER